MALSPTEEEWLEGFLAHVAEHGRRMSQWAKGFIGDQQSRYEEFGSDMSLSTKQWNILKREAKNLGYNPDQPDPDDEE